MLGRRISWMLEYCRHYYYYNLLILHRILAAVSINFVRRMIKLFIARPKSVMKGNRQIAALDRKI